MSNSAIVDLLPGETSGQLANNYMYVSGLQSVLSKTETNLNALVGSLKTVHREKSWRAWMTPDGDIIRNSPDFRKFIESPRPRGCQTPIHILRRAVAGTDAQDVLEELLRGTHGGDHNPYGRAGKPEEEINRTNVTVDSSALIPSDPPPVTIAVAHPKPPRVRDYSRESKQGNTVGYALRRLEKSRPDLLEKVKSGAMSANAGMVAAGFKERSITVPAAPTKAARVLSRNFTGDDLRLLIRELQSFLGGGG